MHRRRIITILLVCMGIAAGVLLWQHWKPAGLAYRGDLVIHAAELQQGIRAYPVGNFIIQWNDEGQDYAGGSAGPRLVVVHREIPGRWLWHTRRGEAFIAAAVGKETVEENRGSYWISDQVSRACETQSVDTIRLEQDALLVEGALVCDDQSTLGYQLAFRAVGERQLQFALTFDDPTINRASITYASGPDEHFYGFGEQFTHFDHKGQRVPIWVSEQGIGRGQQPVTALVNLAAKAGGSAYSTYAAAPHYITSQLRSLFLENSQYAAFDLRDPQRVQVEVYADSLIGRIVFGPEPSDLIAEYTAWAGRMRALPDWILSGAVVGMQGGTTRVDEVLAQLQMYDTPIAAFWLQDWVGQRTTSFGKQLWWNWELDEQRYPDWKSLRDEFAQDNIRLMVYASPFLADAAQKPGVKRNYFAEAAEAGYLVKREDGSPYLIQNTDFSAGMIDLTNPQAWQWYSDLLQREVIETAGASGWMADFGEALPYDAVLFNGLTGAEYHNLYPAAWAELNRALVERQQNGADLVFFMRAASPRSPAYATLFWQGDQLVSWDGNDGLKSAVTSLIGGGMSGLSLNHSDIGGYTGINNPLLRISRSKELLLRWMDFSAFTTIYRTHEGNQPDQNVQFYSDTETLEHFARMAKVYAAWQPLRRKLVDEAAATGMPVARALFLHYPDDPVTYTLDDEYLLGADVLVAPVVEQGATQHQVYLPAGEWVHVWSGKIYRTPFQGQWVVVDAPIGQPPVFYREGTDDGALLRLVVE